MGRKFHRMAQTAETLAALTAVAAAGAAVYTVKKISTWAKDPYATELWLGGCCGKGIMISKGSEPHTYQIRTGFQWQNDVPVTAEPDPCEPELELDIKDMEIKDEA